MQSEQFTNEGKQCFLDYIQELMEVLFENVFDDPRPYIMEVEKIKIPEPLSSQYDRPPKDKVIAGYMSRFSREVV